MLPVALAYLFMAAMLVSVLFPSLQVPEGWMLLLLAAVELFLLLRAYVAFKVRSRIEGSMFAMIFLMVLVAVLL
jgi:hypothetical protein